jgi:tetratricopeptide (TPR) repeat protein
LEVGQQEKAARIARMGGVQSNFAAYMRGCVLSLAGDPAGARSIWTDAIRKSEEQLAEYENPYARSWAGMLFAKLGNREQALRNAQLSLKPDPKHPVHLFFAAQTYSLLGLKHEGLETLKTAVDNGFFNLPMIEYLSRPGMALSAVRDEPEFAAIRADMAKRIDALRARY